MSNITCPACGGQKATQINSHEFRCEYCGHTFTPAAKEQRQANQQFHSESSLQNSSEQPGVILQSILDSTAKSEKNRTTAALLAIILGGFGVHHFYLGNTGKGLLYLVFCWLYIPAVVGFVEGIIFLTQSDEEFAKKYK